MKIQKQSKGGRQVAKISKINKGEKKRVRKTCDNLVVREKDRTVKKALAYLKNWKDIRSKDQKTKAEEAATQLNMSKKTLDDYQTQFKVCFKLGYDFRRAINEDRRMSHLRSYKRERQILKNITKEQKREDMSQLYKLIDNLYNEFKLYEKPIKNKSESKNKYQEKLEENENPSITGTPFFSAMSTNMSLAQQKMMRLNQTQVSETDSQPDYDDEDSQQYQTYQQVNLKNELIEDYQQQTDAALEKQIYQQQNMNYQDHSLSNQCDNSQDKNEIQSFIQVVDLVESENQPSNCYPTNNNQVSCNDQIQVQQQPQQQYQQQFQIQQQQQPIIYTQDFSQTNQFNQIPQQQQRVSIINNNQCSYQPIFQSTFQNNNQNNYSNNMQYQDSYFYNLTCPQN